MVNFKFGKKAKTRLVKKSDIQCGWTLVQTHTAAILFFNTAWGASNKYSSSTKTFGLDNLMVLKASWMLLHTSWSLKSGFGSQKLTRSFGRFKLIPWPLATLVGRVQPTAYYSRQTINKKMRAVKETCHYFIFIKINKRKINNIF